MTRIKTFAAAAFAAVLLTIGVAPAGAAHQTQDGLVNVAIGDITVQDINVGVAAQVAANVCGLKVGPVAVLARTADATGATTTVCTTGTQAVQFIG
jgi:hypothetical protein